MKRIIPIIIILALLVASGFGWFWVNSRPVSNALSLQDFLIEKGEAASAIGEKLESKGLIKSSLAFKIYLKASGLSGSIQAGEFRVSPSYSVIEMVGTFLKGPVELWVTIPEGFRREEIAARFAKSLNKDATFVAEFLSASLDSEGYLFPDTYLFPKDASASAVVAKMKSTFTARTSILKPTKTQVILASLIERETKGKAEKPIVAGIILKRLDAGWPLQIDATLQYGVATVNCKLEIGNCQWWPILTKENISANTPYNSYKFTGFPPTPIANAGYLAIEAAVNPQESEYWYYIHDADGVIHYGKTLDEHNANIRMYLTR